MLGVLTDIDELPVRTRVAIYLFLVSSDYAVRI